MKNNPVKISDDKMENNVLDEVVDGSGKKESLISTIRGIGQVETEDEEFLRLADLMKIIVFEIKDQEFAFDVSDTFEVGKIPHVTRVPNAPRFVKGVINLRGKTVLVLSLSYLLNLNEKVLDKDSRIVLFEEDDEKIAMIVDSIVQIITIQKNLIKPINELETSRISSEFIRGGIILNERIITLLDPQKILSAENLFKADSVIKDVKTSVTD